MKIRVIVSIISICMFVAGLAYNVSVVTMQNELIDKINKNVPTDCVYVISAGKDAYLQDFTYIASQQYSGSTLTIAIKTATEAVERCFK